MVNRLKLLILLFYTLVFIGCVSRNELPQNNLYDFISTKCNVGDELEIGYPVPVIKKIENGDVLYQCRVYRYNFKKNEWEREYNRQSLNIPEESFGGVDDNGDDFSGLRSDLREKIIKIKVLKKGLFLIKTFVEVSTMPEETDFHPELISSIVTSTIIDSRGPPQPLHSRIIPQAEPESSKRN